MCSSGAALCIVAACGGAASSKHGALDSPAGDDVPAAAGASPGGSEGASVGAAGSANVSDGASPPNAGGAGGVAGLDNPMCGSSVYIEGQAALDALEGCEIIYGSLSINFASDLRPLHALREVRGELYLYTPLLPGDTLPDRPETLEGLDNLEHVGGGLVSLQSVRAPSLVPLGKLRADGPLSVRINDCDNLESLTGLNLSGPFRQLQITGNDRLTTLDPLRVIGTEVTAPSIEISGNPSLSGVGALSELTAGLDIKLDGLLVENLGFLDALRTAEELTISGSPRLVDASLPNVQRLGRLYIGSNPRLVEAPEYARLTELVMLWVTENAELLGAPRFPMLVASEPGRSLEVLVTDNPRLERFELPGVVTSSGIFVQGNDSLTSLSFPDLLQIGAGGASVASGGLTLIDNASLTELTLERLAGISDALEVIANPLLGSSALAPLLAFAPPRLKVGLNQGDAAELEPCPWRNDGSCDELPNFPLCALGADGNDCARFR